MVTNANTTPNKIDVPMMLDRLKEEFGIAVDSRMAERIGVSRQTYSAWKNGEGTPDLYKILNLCRDKDIYYILFNERSRIRVDSVKIIASGSIEDITGLAQLKLVEATELMEIARIRMAQLNQQLKTNEE